MSAWYLLRSSDGYEPCDLCPRNTYQVTEMSYTLKIIVNIDLPAAAHQMAQK